MQTPKHHILPEDYAPDSRFSTPWKLSPESMCCVQTCGVASQLLNDRLNFSISQLEVEVDASTMGDFVELCGPFLVEIE